MKVYLIGAGPGDPGLLTVKGKAIIEKADVIIYDALANDALLSHAKHDAECIYVGKIAGQHALPQDQINDLIIAKAKEGKIVARLKGGDPYIFGRGGEEAEELIKAGIYFEEIPGISSTIAGPAYAGIPLTHRDFSSSVTLITGHENPDKPNSVHNWDALAKSASTLVFVMGMKNLSKISQNLIDNGMDKNTPAALIYWGTTPKHRSLISTIKLLPAKAIEQKFTNPSIIVVGNVVTLHNKLNWFEQKPLLGKSIVVTRAREQASGLAHMLTELGAEVIQFPTIKIEALSDYTQIDTCIQNLKDYHCVIFTSVNGVKYFWKRLDIQNLDSRALHKIQIVAIGPATAEILATKGIKADFIPERYVAESIVQGMLSLGVKGKRILLPRALVARDVLPNELRAAGAIIDVVPVYETVPALHNKDKVLALLEQNQIDCITFGSSSTVENFLKAIPSSILKKYPQVKLAAIGPVTAATLTSNDLPCHIQPDEYTIPALVKILKNEL